MRRERIASVLERELSNIVAQEMRDPRLGFVTITEVRVSPDLKEAVVYFSSLEKSSENLATLNRAKGFIRSTLAHRVRIKMIPQLEFRIDESYEKNKHLDALFKEIRENNPEE